MFRKTGIVLAATLVVLSSLILLRAGRETEHPPAAPWDLVVSPPTGETAGEPAPYVGEENKPAAEIAVAGPHGQLVGAPYVTDVTANSALINWVFRGTADTGADERGWRGLHSKVGGLRPGATYYYDVLRDGSGAGGGRFVTPPTGSAGFTFMVYGDTRTREDVHRQVAGKAAERSPAFVLHTGDLVADGLNARLWPGFFVAGQDLFRKTVLFPIVGNHEKNSPLYLRLFPHPLTYYSFDWGDAHFTMMNSDVGTAAPTKEERERFWSEQLKWLEEDLRGASSAQFRFVALHHPPFTAMGKRQAGAKKLAADLAPIFQKHHVQAVFSGHDHNYQRHIVDGVQYIVTGGGGAPLYDLDSPIPGVTQKAVKVENFVLAKVNGPQCAMEAVALDGSTIESFVIHSKSPAKAASAAGAQ